jgi:hypothetical protein
MVIKTEEWYNDELTAVALYTFDIHAYRISLYRAIGIKLGANAGYGVRHC